MSLLNQLSDPNMWQMYREHKIQGHHISARELSKLDEFIESQRYLEITEHITDEVIPFDLPHRKTVNKSGTNKKRVVYTYSDSEMMVLKLLMFLLKRYEDKLSPSCYSFRSTRTVKSAITEIVRAPYAGSSYVYKADIHNYFNSMDVELLMKALGEVIQDDPELIKFLYKLLSVNKAYDGDSDRIVEENRGGMAGAPISPFFANVYLKALDDSFDGVPYYRYSDDILIFAPDEATLNQYIEKFTNMVTSMKLQLNPDKISVTSPGEPWEFLGFKYSEGQIDISEVTLGKIKAKIKRKANKLYRWRVRKDVEFDSTAKVMIRVFNRKFYGSQIPHSDDEDGTEEEAEEPLDDFTWSRWFFPLLDTAESLEVIDDYLVEYIRYLKSGRHYKGNYKITYEHIKSLGFRSLVNEFYKFKTTE